MCGLLVRLLSRRLRGPVRQGLPPILSGSLIDNGSEVEVVWSCDRSGYNRFYFRIWLIFLALFAVFGLAYSIALVPAGRRRV